MEAQPDEAQLREIFDIGLVAYRDRAENTRPSGAACEVLTEERHVLVGRRLAARLLAQAHGAGHPQCVAALLQHQSELRVVDWSFTMAVNRCSKSYASW